MPAAATPLPKNSDLGIFLRLWDKQKLTPTLSRHLLRLEFSEEDKERMHHLAEKNQNRRLSRVETQELDNFVRVGTMLSILQSRARQSLVTAR